MSADGSRVPYFQTRICLYVYIFLYRWCVDLDVPIEWTQVLDQSRFSMPWRQTCAAVSICVYCIHMISYMIMICAADNTIMMYICADHVHICICTAVFHVWFGSILRGMRRPLGRQFCAMIAFHLCEVRLVPPSGPWGFKGKGQRPQRPKPTWQRPTWRLHSWYTRYHISNEDM